jgi:hypothetical protein
VSPSLGVITEHVIPATPDPVIVAEFEDGGLISYRKPDGSFIHTVNTSEGLDRKLRQLGIRRPNGAPAPSRVRIKVC